MISQFVAWATRISATWPGSRTEASNEAIEAMTGLGARVAALELDLRDRDKEIRQLRQEYELQREQTLRQRNEAAAVGFESLARQLAPTLSQLATMQALADMDRAVQVEDILKLFEKVEQVLTRAGLTRIGTVSAMTTFDPRAHQRMSGVDLDDGDPVIIRFVGYRLGEIVLLKAMVMNPTAQTRVL
ncbi:molecular chaperone GrpE [Gammaproteobacteria bacterium]